MLTQTPILLLSLFTLLAVAAPLPQEGNKQLGLHNESPSSRLAPSTAAPTAAAATSTPSTVRDLSAAVAAEALKGNANPPITGEDGTELGMAAAMQGIGTATGALGALPPEGGMGGLGARGESNIRNRNKRTPLAPGLDIKRLPLVGSLGLGGRDTSKLDKTEAQVGTFSVFNPGNKVKRQEVDTEPLLPGAEKGAIAEVKEAKKPIDPVDSIKKLAAIVADARGVTAKGKRRSFSKGIIDSTNSKTDSQFNSALEDAERTDHPENTSFPPGMPVKTPQDALNKRTDDQERESDAEHVQDDVLENTYPALFPLEEGQQKTHKTHEELKRQPLDLKGAVLAKDLIDNASGQKSVMDSFKSLSSAVQNSNA
ncbi:unnamed protein product [Tuber aestivum]|uniref:Uncharacterized protein n=1 Tax=Tuber aestivum TaxID=59557 RepID=A0A292PK37_9PEZI|nr:unnamed protein product [Tuber aestivum]